MKYRAFTFLISFFIFFFSNCGTAQKEQADTAKISLPDAGLLPLGDSPFERDFVAKFKVLNLPFLGDAEATIQDTISADLVIQNILEKAEKAGSNTFKDFWGDDKIKEETRKGLKDRFLNLDKNVFMVLNFGYVGRLPLSNAYFSLIFKTVPTFMEGGYAYTYLANFSKEGEFIDAVQIGGVAGYVDIQSNWTSKIDAEGKIVVNAKTVKSGGMEDQTADFTELAYLTYQIDSKGAFILQKEKHTGFSGNFKNIESQEFVYVEEFPGDLRIRYESAEQAQTELEVVKFDKPKNLIVAKNPENGKELTLTYDSDKKLLTCALNGKKTTFGRIK